MNEFDVFDDLDSMVNQIQDNDQAQQQNDDDQDYNRNWINDDDDYNTDINDDDQPKDLITTLLQQKGINRNSIQIQNEEGEMEEVNFDDLSEEEKLDLLSAPASQDPISDDELKTINYLRTNKMSLQDLIKWQREEAVKEYLAQSQEPQYNVDSMTDDELYMFDLQDRYEDITDEELQQELENAKSNEALFQKKIASLRKEYKELEDQNAAAQQQKEREEYEQQFNQLAQSLVDVARSSKELHGLLLEDEDKEAVLSFLLDKDANGQSGFYKLLEKPESLFKMAWYAIKGEEAFENINNYYKGVIEKTRRQASPQSRVVRKSTPKRDEDDVFDLASQYNNI